MKKLAVLVCTIGIPYILFNLATIVSHLTGGGWHHQAVTNLLLLFVVLLILGLAGAGLGALVASSVKNTSG